MMELNAEFFKNLLHTAGELLLKHGLNLLYALFTLLVGLWLIGFITRVSGRAIQKGISDLSVANFLRSLVNVSLKVTLLLSIASMLGIQTTSFLAILGSASLAVGLALQGSLSNLAGGVLLLIFKPLKVGDLVTLQGHFGRVVEIQTFTTVICTGQNETVIIPNAMVSNGIIKNHSQQGKIRLDLEVSIAYHTNIALAKKVAQEVISKNTLLLDLDKSKVALKSFGDSAMILAIRVWAKPDEQWNAQCSVLEELKKAFDEAGIEIPFPQRVVHLKQDIG